MRALIFLGLVACGSAADGDDSGTPRVDADDNNTMLTGTDVTCVTRTRSVMNASSRSETRTYFALVDGVTRDMDFAVEQCDFRQTTNGVDAVNGCPTGSTCTNTGAAAPMEPACSWSRRSGSFTADGKLNVYCGTGVTSYDAGGTVLSTYESRYMRVRIYK
ncbi:MAG: hypothetical protein M4D80_24165 [Myxococcota bacterium]|nr:hypothetical protein [Myxococcota bacterium]